MPEGKLKEIVKRINPPKLSLLKNEVHVVKNQRVY